MDFKPSPEVAALRERVLDFMDDDVYPREREIMEGLDAEVTDGVPYPKVLIGIRERARSEGLWNLFMPDERFGPGLSNWEYGLLCEEMGRSPAAAPMAFNCSAPDTGNMEILAEHGSEEQRSAGSSRCSRADPLLLLDDRARGLRLGPDRAAGARGPRRRRVGDRRPQVVTSGAVGADLRSRWSSPTRRPPLRARLDDLRADRHAGLQPGATDPGDGPRQGPRPLRDQVRRVPGPRANLLGEQGAGFAVAQDRLGPGRIHHCMRAIGTAERALEDDVPACQRARASAGRSARSSSAGVDRRLADGNRPGRLLTMYAAWKMDTEGKRAARQSISAIKVVAANMVMDVLDRSIQVHGSLGMTDTRGAALWPFSRMLRLADGPDEVHKMVLARRESTAGRSERRRRRGRARLQARPAGDLKKGYLVAITLAPPKPALMPLAAALRISRRRQASVCGSCWCPVRSEGGSLRR